MVLELVVDDDEVIRRLSGAPPALRRCDGQLYQRDDDKPETVPERLAGVPGTDRAAVDFYEAEGQLVGIDATGTGRGRHRPRHRRAAASTTRAAELGLRGGHCDDGRGPVPSAAAREVEWTQIQIKTPDQIELMRAAGLVVAGALAAVRAAVAPGCQHRRARRRSPRTSSGRTARCPSFLGLPRLPGDDLRLGQRARSCTPSPVPSASAAEGDTDLDRLRRDPATAGTATPPITVTVGEAVGPDAAAASRSPRTLDVGRPGRRRVAPAGPAAPTSRRGRADRSAADGGRYGIVDGYGGHGIGTEMHQDPHVLNHGRPGRGPRLVPGLALAIEPMITVGSPRPSSSPTAGPWSPRTARWPRTSSTRWPSRRRGLGAHRRGRRLAGLAPSGSRRAARSVCLPLTRAGWRLPSRAGVQWPTAFAPFCRRAVAA